jgi:hypothetical protein
MLLLTRTPLVRSSAILPARLRATRTVGPALPVS